MASRLDTFRKLVPQLGSALKSFQSSEVKFRVIRTVDPNTKEAYDPAAAPQSESPKRLFILDSSFNPPSIAHLSLCQSVLQNFSSDRYEKPHRLLLLFSTMNADKAPSAASFDQRLALMTVFATDLLDIISKQPDEYSVVPVDIGLTTEPYYTDKSKAIEEVTSWYPDKPKHIHCVGFDTLTRFFAAKYYQNFDPPFSALSPYFNAGHQLRVTLRPDNDYGSIEDQQAFLCKLEDGSMEKDGGKREWAKQVELVEPNKRAGVSSTKIRKAAKSGDWDLVNELCTPGVAGWVRTQGLYEDDDRGAKMA